MCAAPSTCFACRRVRTMWGIRKESAVVPGFFQGISAFCTMRLACRFVRTLWGIRGGSAPFSGDPRPQRCVLAWVLGGILPAVSYVHCGGSAGDPRGIRALFGGSASSAVCFGVGFGGIRPRPLSPFIILKGGIGVALGLAKDIGRNRDEPCSQTLLRFYNALCFLVICRPF